MLAAGPLAARESHCKVVQLLAVGEAPRSHGQGPNSICYTGIWDFSLVHWDPLSKAKVHRAGKKIKGSGDRLVLKSGFLTSLNFKFHKGLLWGLDSLIHIKYPVLFVCGTQYILPQILVINIIINTWWPHRGLNMFCFTRLLSGDPKVQSCYRHSIYTDTSE